MHLYVQFSAYGFMASRSSTCFPVRDLAGERQMKGWRRYLLGGSHASTRTHWIVTLALILVGLMRITCT